MVGEVLGDALAVGDGDADTGGDALGDPLTEGLADGLTDTDGLGDALTDGLTEGEALGDALGEALALGVAVGEGSLNSSASLPISQLLLRIGAPAGQFSPGKPANGGMMSPHPGVGKRPPVCEPWPFRRVTDSVLTVISL